MGRLPDRILYTVGRWTLVSLLIVGSLLQMREYGSQVEGLSRTMPLASLVLPATIALKLVGSLLIIRDGKGARASAILLGIYMLVVAIFFHGFWLVPEDKRPMAIMLFHRDVAIAGALFMYAAWKGRVRAPHE